MNKDAVRARLVRFEGSIPYMYRCTGGEVTVGVGHAIPTAEDAERLPWNYNHSVTSDYGLVRDAPSGKVASFYSSLSICRMGQTDIDQLCLSDIDKFEAQLKQKLPNWDRYPALAQEALFDMGFNLGVAGVMKFPTMLAAVDAGNWPVASLESHRKGIQASRNQEIADLFLLAGE